MGMRVDISKMKAAHGRIRAMLPGTRVTLIREYARSIVHGLARLAPRDTNRYVRGWIIAGKMVGIQDVPLPVIRESKYIRQYIEALVGQVERFGREIEAVDGLIYAWYDKPGRRRTGYYNTLLARRQKAEHRLERARDELQKFISRTDSIVMGVGINTAKAPGGGTRVTGWWAKDQGRRLSITVRDRVYGGHGRLIQSPGRAVLMLSNKEPHTRHIERKRAVLARAEAGARIAGLRRLGSGYQRAIVAAAEAGVANSAAI